jgi:SAM-dependent methyltransferase
LSPANPFGADRFGFTFEVLRSTPAVRRHLDYGCFDGSFLAQLHAHIGRDLDVVGVDVNGDALRRLLQAHPEVACARISDRGRLPFRDGAFDSVSCLEVLEHVTAQRRRELLVEFSRILAPDGVLVVSTPGQHLFSVLDLGNVKFRVPRLHRLFVEARHGKAHYERRYRNNEFRLVGDVSVDAGWHAHFSSEELSSMLAEAQFEVTDVDGAGLFALPLTALAVGLPVPRAKAAVDRLQKRDAASYGRANLFIASRKRPA